MDTELKLLNWREGSINAERLCANVLRLDGFSSVDPQCPLGGPDGLKDVLCEKNGWKYVGAAYFPPTEKTFKDVLSKFEHDLEGVSVNNCDGLSFLTNQHLTPKEREELIQIAEAKGHKCIIYHRERIRVILDTPSGFAVRLEYLGIEMTKEEQLSFFSQWNSIFENLLQDHSDYIISELSKKIDTLKSTSFLTVDMPPSKLIATQSTVSMLLPPLSRSNKAHFHIPASPPTTDELTIETLCMLHRALSYDHPHSKEMGKLRQNKVWIGGPSSDPKTARYVPPPPEKVPQLTEDLINWWVKLYPKLIASNDKTEILNAIVKFHSDFLTIHPFLDGNGRLARFLLMQQANELLKIDRSIVLEDNAPYFDALLEAQQGNIEPLRVIITQALYGEEKIDG